MQYQATYYTNLSAKSYHPFGMAMPGRSYNSPEYRFGFNGMEKSDEIAGGDYTTHYRMLDTRLGRWFSTDPVFHAFQSPYNSFDNNPIIYVDHLGSDVFVTYSGIEFSIGWAEGFSRVRTTSNIRDNIGYTQATAHYKVTFDAHDTWYEGCSAPELITGLDVGWEVGFLYDWGSDTYEEHVNKSSPVNFSGLVVDFAIGDEMIGANVGLNIGVAVSSIQLDEITSVSVTKEENNAIGKGTYDVINEELYIDIEGNRMYRGQIQKTYIDPEGGKSLVENTGVYVYSEIVKTYDKEIDRYRTYSNGQWETNEYSEAKKGN